MELAETGHPLQQKRPIPFTCCYLIHNQFIYMRFSLTNNIRVEVVSSLLEETTGSIELQHLLEAKVDMPLQPFFFELVIWTEEFWKQTKYHQNQYSGSSLLHEINFHPSKPADWFYQDHLSLAPYDVLIYLFFNGISEFFSILACLAVV